MSSILNTVIKATLKAGKHPIQVLGYAVKSNANGEYLEVQFVLPDRVIKQNYFPERPNSKGTLNYFGGALKRQMGLEDKEMSITEILDHAKTLDADKLFTIVSYTPEYGMNMAFHERMSVEETASKAPEVTFDDVK